MVSILSLKGRVWSGYLLAFLLLLVSYFLIFYIMERSIRQSSFVTHTYIVINKLEALKGEVTEAETGIRGYIITKEERFLAPYNNALDRIPGLYDELKQLTSDNKIQQDRLDTFRHLIDERLGYMATALDDFRMHGMIVTENMRLSRESAKQVMDSIRTFAARLEATEEQQSEQRKEQLSKLFRNNQLIAMASLAIAFITLFYSLIIFNKENTAKERAIKKATQYSIQLEANIQELQHTNLELQELKSLEKFTATGRISRTLAHEVRNPLTNISLAAEQLMEMNGKEHDSAILLEMISRNAARINQLVSELLNATRFANLEFQRMDINQVMEEMMEMAKDRIDLNHILVEKNYSRKPCLVMVDSEKMKLALLNIVVNAIEAMEKDKGVLSLETKKQGDKCIIEIRDNGKGMDEDVLQKLFEPYFTGKMNGNGLGLTNTQNIIFNHKGSIKVFSKPDKGAIFTIVLNIAEPETVEQ